MQLRTPRRAVHRAERLTREALGLAGATVEPWRVWVEDWSAVGDANEVSTLRLRAEDDAIGLDLGLTSTVPHVAHGDRGLDAKGAEVGNASHYYSVPRLAADGAVTVEGEAFAVTGLAWLDREWSTSSLEPGIVGWDWFALHLSDGGSRCSTDCVPRTARRARTAAAASSMPTASARDSPRATWS